MEQVIGISLKENATLRSIDRITVLNLYITNESSIPSQFHYADEFQQMALLANCSVCTHPLHC